MRFLLLFCGYILFAFGLQPGAHAQAGVSLSLAAGLFAESNWPACRLECRRQLQESPASPDARLLQALAEQRMGMDRKDALRAIAEDPAMPPDMALTARYEWARTLWGAGDWRGAFDAFREVFAETEITGLSVRAGCSLALLMNQHAELSRDFPEIMAQARTLRALYTREIIDECRLPAGKTASSLLGLPGQWTIAFYRSQIRPVLGERCSLCPNCSEYSRQAFQKHGALGLALTADRFFREPSVVAAGAQPVDVNGKIFYADPLSDHDWWLGE